MVDSYEMNRYSLSTATLVANTTLSEDDDIFKSFNSRFPPPEDLDVSLLSLLDISTSNSSAPTTSTESNKHYVSISAPISESSDDGMIRGGTTSRQQMSDLSTNQFAAPPPSYHVAEERILQVSSYAPDYNMPSPSCFIESLEDEEIPRYETLVMPYTDEELALRLTQEEEDAAFAERLSIKSSIPNIGVFSAAGYCTEDDETLAIQIASNQILSTKLGLPNSQSSSAHDDERLARLLAAGIEEDEAFAKRLQQESEDEEFARKIAEAGREGVGQLVIPPQHKTHWWRRNSAAKMKLFKKD